MTSIVARFRDAAWLTRERAVVWGGALLVEQILLLLGVVLWAYGVLGSFPEPIWPDFPSFYGAGRLVLSGAPQLAYDRLAHYQAEQQATAFGNAYIYFFYPPPFLFLCAALACLPYMVAFSAFQAATLVLFLLVVRRILQASGWAWCVPVLAFPAVFWNLGLGQTAFLTAALFGAGTLTIDKRPLLGGTLFGLLCYKPHFGLLIPIALAAGRRWSAFGAAAATVAGLVAASAALFGWQTWQAYVTALLSSESVYETGRIMFAGYVTPFGAARLIGLDAGSAYILQGAVSILAAGAVMWIWRRNAPLPVRSAALASGTLLSIPLALLYDLLLIMIGIAWFVRGSRQGGYRPWEKSLLAGLYVIAFFLFLVGVVLDVPLGPLAAASMLALCLIRTLSGAPPIRPDAP